MIVQQILYIVVGIDIVIFSVLLGVVLGQHSVWKHLRKKDVMIGEWEYKAIKNTKNVIKYWD